MFILNFINFLKEEFPRSSLKEKIGLVLGASVFVLLAVGAAFLIHWLSWQDFIVLSAIGSFFALAVGWVSTMARYETWKIHRNWK